MKARKTMKTNRLQQTGFGFFTLRSQYGLLLDNAVYTDQDHWLLLGKLRFQRIPLLYYAYATVS